MNDNDIKLTCETHNIMRQSLGRELGKFAQNITSKVYIG
jgi:hypothetical protein